MTTQHRNDLGPVIDKLVADVGDHLVTVRRDIHAHPELGFEVQRTAGVVASELGKLGISCRTGVGRTGVVAEISGRSPGPCLVVRADMDALPMEERTALPFASTISARMHACGHDLHTATLLGVGAVLNQLKDHWRGRLRLVFQPAEETIDSGAAAMIADGVLDDVDMALGFHNHPARPAGLIGFTTGASFASADSFVITITGLSGHAAVPYKAIDPIVAAGFLLTQLQSIVSREVNPSRGAVLTVGKISGGDAYNIIPEHCTLAGTIRTRSPETRDLMESALRRICDGIALTHRVTCDVNYRRNLPPMLNDPDLLKTIVEAARAQRGAAAVMEFESEFGAEDFALFSEHVPCAHLMIGSGQEGRSDKLHNSDYQPDEASIQHGVAVMARAALDLLA